MCQRSPGPRCASHTRAEMKAALVKLDKEMASPDATENSIRKASKEYKEACLMYDSTPTGQKEITQSIKELQEKFAIDKSPETKSTILKEKRRLKKAENIRLEQTYALARVEEQERVIATIDREIAQDEESPTFESEYRRKVGNLIASRGYLISNEGWGGDHADYDDTNHLKECGAKYAGNIADNGTISSYDTFSERTVFGLKAKITCNCNKLVERDGFYQNESLPEMIKYMDDGDDKTTGENIDAPWWDEE